MLVKCVVARRAIFFVRASLGSWWVDPLLVRKRGNLLFLKRVVRMYAAGLLDRLVDKRVLLGSTQRLA